MIGSAEQETMSQDNIDMVQRARSQTIGDLLRRSAKRFPRKPAVICGDIRWSYDEFNSICNQLARGFASIGVEHGDRVAILSRNSLGFAACRYALAKL
jgi:fatty-acyl-CoA synthase